MPSITLDDEQARIFSESGGSVEIRDRHGRRLGVVQQLFTADDIAEFTRRSASDEPRYTTEQVLDHLRSLEQA
jgi:hypothetical protein